MAGRSLGIPEAGEGDRLTGRWHPGSARPGGEGGESGTIALVTEGRLVPGGTADARCGMARGALSDLVAESPTRINVIDDDGDLPVMIGGLKGWCRGWRSFTLCSVVVSGLGPIVSGG